MAQQHHVTKAGSNQIKPQRIQRSFGLEKERAFAKILFISLFNMVVICQPHLLSCIQCGHSRSYANRLSQLTQILVSRASALLKTEQAFTSIPVGQRAQFILCCGINQQADQSGPSANSGLRSCTVWLSVKRRPGWAPASWPPMPPGTRPWLKQKKRKKQWY